MPILSELANGRSKIENSTISKWVCTRVCTRRRSSRLRSSSVNSRIQRWANVLLHCTAWRNLLLQPLDCMARRTVRVALCALLVREHKNEFVLLSSAIRFKLKSPWLSLTIEKYIHTTIVFTYIRRYSSKLKELWYNIPQNCVTASALQLFLTKSDSTQKNSVK